jgi:hypothetical protein
MKFITALSHHKLIASMLLKKTRCVMKHKSPSMRQIPEVAIIVKTQGQDFKIYGSNIKV